MAELIPDGYTRLVKLRSQGRVMVALSRPLPLRQARLHLQLLRQLPKALSRRRLNKLLRQQAILEPRDSDSFDDFLRGMEVSELQVAARSLLFSPTAVEDARNLLAGVSLEVRHPHLAKVTCDQCRDWWFDPIEGTTVKDQDGNAARRESRDDVLCNTLTGCPRGHFTNPVSLSDKNRQAWRHFQECDAVGRFPDDPMVAFNASVIRDVLEREDRRARTDGSTRRH